MGRRTFLVILGLVLLVLPTASAQTDAQREDACLMPTVAALCDMAIDARMDEMFPGFADLVLLVLLDLVAVLALVGLVKVLALLRPFPTLRFKAKERVKEVEPGGGTTFEFELENLQSNAPAEVVLERPTLPGYWTADVTARTQLDSGFLVPQDMAEDNHLFLTAKRQGANRARLLLEVRSPGDTTFEETLDYSLRAVPILGQRVRKGKAKTVRVTVLVSPSVPSVEITDVQHDPARIAPGVPVSTRVVVLNKGDKEADGADIVFYLNGSVVTSKSLPKLVGGASETITFDWTPAPGENRVRLVIE
jgi:hypothetical protein